MLIPDCTKPVVKHFKPMKIADFLYWPFKYGCQLIRLDKGPKTADCPAPSARIYSNKLVGMTLPLGDISVSVSVSVYIFNLVSRTSYLFDIGKPWKRGCKSISNNMLHKIEIIDRRRKQETSYHQVPRKWLNMNPIYYTCIFKSDYLQLYKMPSAKVLSRIGLS